MSVKTFVDTNVLVYGRDAGEPEKQPQAAAWITYLWESRNGRLSIQVLQEYNSTVTTRLKPGLEPADARNDIRALFAWRPIPVNGDVIEGEWFIQDRFKLSWWDSLIVSAAQIGDCGYLLTEDLQADQLSGNVRILSPFLHSPDVMD